jgi:hypothetical protein
LREVLGYHANEVADMLDSTVESVNSALKRARASLALRLPVTDEYEVPPFADSPAERALVAKFVRAYQSGDVHALVELLTADVRVSMPPIPLEYYGREVVQHFYAHVLSQRKYYLVPTRANGQLAFGAYLAASAGGLRHAAGLLVLTLRGNQISGIVRFDNDVLPAFGLPRSLPY